MAIHFLDADDSVRSVEYVGKVLQVSHNASYRIMSDVYGSADEALVWNDETQRPTLVVYRVCDYAWCSNSHAEVDADEETRVAYFKWKVGLEVDKIYIRRVEEANKIEVGCQVEVVKGRKVAKGTKGKVVFLKNYPGYNGGTDTKLCVATSDKTEKHVARNGREYERHVDVVWVSMYNCKRLDVTPISREEIYNEVIENFKECMAA